MTTTFLDANVLILAYKGESPLRALAQRVLGDSERVFVASPFLALEVCPYSRDLGEAEFFKSYFEDQVLAFRGDLQQIVDIAYQEAERHGIKAMDALHVAAAWLAGARQLVTAEEPKSAIYRTKLIMVTNLADPSL